MQIINNWQQKYSQDDAFRSMCSKSDLIYMLNKFTIKKNGIAPKYTELRKLKRKQLTAIWFKLGMLRPVRDN